ncbi:TonB-dependent receptor [Iodidimonas sp. SYSU 1G8]|uniref:TonB-dependent receptor n=1 Tax=Iodidimonas sp. SYSU 1G8 TaxID=3133967 RepID=UPI0031FF3751
MEAYNRFRTLRKPLGVMAVSAIALSSGVALAQDAAQEESQSRGVRTRLETVITQAQKVESSAQTTPIATTTVEGDELRRAFVVDLRDLTNQAPNVMLEPVGAFQNAAAFSIRGFGTADIESSADPSVPVFIDGVYMARNSTSLSDLLDISAVEILRGPQGTLFGRNTIAGAVLVRHNKPDTSDFSVSGSVEAGNYGTLNIEGVVNVPVVEDKFAIRLAAKSSNNDGFYKNLTDGSNYGGADRITLMPSLIFTPNDNLEVIIRGEYVRERNDSWANTPYSVCRSDANGNFSPLTSQTVPLIGWAYEGNSITRFCGQERGKQDFVVEHDNTSGRGSDFDVKGLTGEINYSIPDVGTITYVGNYRDVYEDVYNDFDTTPLPIFMTRRQQWHWQTTHELRFSSDFSDTIEFVGGVFYFKQHYRMEQDTFGWLFDPNFGAALGQAIGARLTGGANPGQYLDALNPNSAGFGETIHDHEAWSVFAQVNYHITDSLTFVAGVRYNQESKDIETCAPATVNSFVLRECNTNPNAPGFNYFDSDTDILAGNKNKWNDIGPKVGLNWQATDDLFLYASWTRGFRGGGFNGRCGSTQTCQPYDQERADSYEVGMKWDGLDNRLRVNLTGFWMEYADQQVGIIRSSAGSGGGQETVTDNAADAVSRGIELEITAVPADGLKLWMTGGYLDAKRTDFCVDIDGPSTVNPGPASGSCDPDNAFSFVSGGSTFFIFPTDNSNLPLVRAPKWTFSAGLSYEIPVGSLGFLEFAGDWRYQSKSNQASNGVPAGSIAGIPNFNGFTVTPVRDAAHIFNASMTFREIDDRYKVSFFVRNLTNERYLQSLTAVATLFNFIQDNNPRTWGVKISFDM